MKRLIGCLILFCLMGVNNTYAQSITVEGNVNDESGVPLPGVTIIVEGTSQGTLTDFNGYYTLSVPSGNAKIVFSYIGMKTITELVNNRTTINAVLKENFEQLESVIVVAYGTSTKEAYTGAAAIVDNETIEDRPVSSFEKALQGTTAGLMVSSSSGQPGAGSTVRIRGIGSLSASSAPLFILDGAPMSGAISDINPNDIETVTVLKDAAASSLYGSRAANGVILITTKQGKSGTTKISFSSQLGISQRISDGYALMNSTQFYEQSWMGLYNEALLDGETISQAQTYAHEEVKDVVGYNPFGVDTPLDNTGKLIPGTQILTNTDWRDEIYKIGFIKTHNINISGGSDLTKVFMSLGYYSDSGTTLGSTFSRITNKINVSHKINDFLKAGMNSHISYSKTIAPPGGTGFANPVRSAEIINSASPVYDGAGNYEWGNKAVLDFNPVALADLDKYIYKTKRAVVNAHLDVDFSSKLKFRTTIGIDTSLDDGLNYYNPDHGNGAGVNGRTTASRSDLLSWNISNILTYSHANDISLFEVLVGQEALGTDYSVLSAAVTDFGIPGKIDLSWGASPEQPGSFTTSSRMVSYLSQIKYDYDSRYYFSTSARIDGSSRFGENNKYGLFYSVGGGWQLSKEDWMPDWSWLNNAKLRASYGTSGNNNIGNYASLGLYGNGFNYSGSSGIGATQLENLNLSWEKIQSANIGLELNLFSKLDASFEFYNRNSDGLLFGKPLSAISGIGTILSNLGAMSNRGIEASFKYNLIDNNNFYSSIGFNISTNSNKILELTTEKIVSGTKLLEEGSSLYQFYMREWAGVNPDNGKPMWYVNDSSDDKEDNIFPESAFDDPLGSGKKVTSSYNDAERKRLGNSLPKVFGGINYDLSYKNLALNFYLYYSLGGKAYNNDYATNMHDGTQSGNNLALDAARAWTPNNRYTDVPRYVKNNTDQSEQMSSRFIEDASYIRLKNINLSYQFSESTCKAFKLNSLKAFVSAENFLTFTKFKGFDPEVAINGTTNNNIPGVKVVTMGLKLEL
ncbi:SusC/RagA family TonB-linked outer membrane protein [Bacteroidota bacterium]